MKKKNAVKILVPCLIVAAIIGIYLFKNPPSSIQAPEDPATPEDAAFALTATKAIDFEALSEYGLPIIVDYGSDSCIPCQQMAPVLKAMNEEMAGKAFIKFVDVWENAAAASNVPVQVIPTQVLVNADGTPFVPSDELAQMIEFILYSSRETGEHVFTVHQGGMTEEQMRLNGGRDMIDSWLNTLGTLISESVWLAPLLALLAGVLTSFTPCSLSSIPLVIGYVGGTGTEPKKAFRLSLVFAAGSAITFTILGTLASLAGRLIGTSASWWYLILGVLMVLMALQTWEIFNFIPSTYLLSKNTRRGYAGALIAGILGGIFSSPCATPVLVALLAIVAGKGNVIWGMLLLLLYSIGHGALTIFAGTSIGFVRSLTQNEKYGRASRWLKWIMGAAILVIGLYMFYLAF